MSYIKNIKDGGCSSCKKKYRNGGCDCGTCMNDGCNCAADGRKRRRSRSRSKRRRSSKRRSRSSRRRRH